MEMDLLSAYGVTTCRLELQWGLIYQQAVATSLSPFLSGSAHKIIDESSNLADLSCVPLN